MQGYRTAKFNSRQNTELLKEINELRLKVVNCQSKLFEPTQKFEKSERRIRANIQFFWEYFQHALYKLKNHAPRAVSDIAKLRKTIQEYKMYDL